MLSWTRKRKRVKPVCVSDLRAHNTMRSTPLPIKPNVSSLFQLKRKAKLHIQSADIQYIADWASCSISDSCSIWKAYGIIKCIVVVCHAMSLCSSINQTWKGFTVYQISLKNKVNILRGNKPLLSASVHCWHISFVKVRAHSFGRILSLLLRFFWAGSGNLPISGWGLSEGLQEHYIIIAGNSRRSICCTFCCFQ